MFTKFEQEIVILTEGTTAMGVEELLLDLAEKKVLRKAEKRGLSKAKQKKNGKASLLLR